jgi:alpha-L-fucosidase
MTTSPSRLDWFTEARFGLFIHWGLYALAARHEWVRRNEKLTGEQYRKYFEHFDPDLYDPREWARLAREAGMKYVVITAKHHEGFCLWDSAATDYKAPNTPAGRDLLAPFVEAFRAEGLRVGFYYSLLDWHHPQFPVDRHHPQAEDAAYREAEKGRDVRQYAAYMRAQTEELLTRFGPIDLLWYDFSYAGEDGKGRADWESEELVKLIRKLAPDIILNNRLDLPGSPDFDTPEQYQPTGPRLDEAGRPIPWEGCQTFSGSWGYHRDEMTWKSVPQLLGMLIDGVSKGGNLLLNVGPTARGEFDGRARECLAGLGAWLRHHGRAIYGCGIAPAEFTTPADCRLTWNPVTRRLYIHLLAWPYRHLHLPGLAGRVKYAQFLHDASEIHVREREAGDPYNNLHSPIAEGAAALELPTNKPWPEVPVVEVFLR